MLCYEPLNIRKMERPPCYDGNYMIFYELLIWTSYELNYINMQHKFGELEHVRRE